MTKETAYPRPTYTTRTLVLVYPCFSLPVVELFFFMGLVRYDELPTIVVLGGLVLNALVGFDALWLAYHAYSQVAEHFGSIEILLRDVPEGA